MSSDSGKRAASVDELDRAATPVGHRAELELAPIAHCRLDPVGLRTQADRYRRLRAAVTHVDRRPRALTVAFGPGLDEALLHETLAVERECCAFFDVRYEPAVRRLSIGVGEPEYDAALDALQAALASRAPG